MSDWPQKFLHAFKELHHYESISAAHSDLSLDDAYDIQHAFITLRKEPVSGFKAALTAPAAQEAMGINTPIIGALFASGDHPAEQPIDLDKPVLLETELGFRLAVAPDGPVNTDQVFDLVDACMPMVEIASPNLATQPNALDLVATNSASHCYVRGDAYAMDTTDFDQIDVELYADGERIWQARSDDVLGGQREALSYLINEVLARNYALQPGHILMTGSIGGMLPAAPGSYRAQFGPLGSLALRVRDANKP